ncbi:7896_t:CDS:2 [Entrophospora sp. SA101]|nr:7896_t:CDS:2 [Entrophospora sp. SA101]
MLLQLLQLIQQAQHNLFKEEQEALHGIILQPYMERQDAIIAPGDPRLKLNYYKENNWERRYINSAQKLIYDVYQVEISNNENDGEDDLTSQIYKHKHIAHNSNELDLYLKDPNAQEKTDVLLW